MPQYLVRLAQIHESFRKAELHALANLAGVELEIVKYDDDVGTFALFSFFSRFIVKISFFKIHLTSILLRS